MPCLGSFMSLVYCPRGVWNMSLAKPARHMMPWTVKVRERDLLAAFSMTRASADPASASILVAFAEAVGRLRRSKAALT
ncbi:MAG TPA: hypothetical protein DD435_11470 [Cyanobacteria bacterium UBA8530]|nr:hypothetical protein [Cyanobacteria bacterium UBA8530]